MWHSRHEDGPTSPFARTVTDSGGSPSWDHQSAHSVADATIAERLAVPERTPVMRTAYVFRADGLPIQLSTSWEPLDLIAGTPVEWPEAGAAVGVIARYDHIGLRIDTVDEIVWARMPDPREQDTLNVPPGVPVMVIERTYTAAGRPVETADIILPADRHRLHYGMPVA